MQERSPGTADLEIMYSNPEVLTIARPPARDVPERSAPPRAGPLVLWAALAAAALWLGMGLAAPTPVAAQTGGVTVNKEVSTTNNDGTAINGETIAYSIIINNNTDSTLQDMLILDVLPENVLDSVNCLDAPDTTPCSLINETREIPEPLGGTLTVTTTRQISWTVPSMPPNSSLIRSFTARVIGQADGATFNNVAYVSYRQNGQTRDLASNEVSLTVLLDIGEGGASTLSDAPTWFSQDAGGTLSMDWADFDGDGDLDLVLGSTLGVTVYRNVNGDLRQFWSNTSQPAFGVRWADVDGDGTPEIVTVGAVDGEADGSQTNLAPLPGVNTIYRYDPTTGATNRRFAEMDAFTSTKQLVRVETGDFTGDGATDIVASTNAINPECPVELYVNDGSGVFDEPPVCVSRSATAALKPVDFDNDGDLDLALGLFPNQVSVLRNNEGSFDSGNAVTLEEGVMFLPYDFAWGDFDRDGYLDLAAAYPLLREVRIYRNLEGEEGREGFATPVTLRTNVFLTPYALDWGDFSGDGELDLAVADSPPVIYSYKGGYSANSFQPFFVVEDGAVQGQVWSLRAVDQNGDGDVDLALTDRDGPSLIVSNFRPPLNPSPATIAGVPPFSNAAPASSVQWADADGDDDLDLFFGAAPSSSGPAALNSKIYYNDEGQFLPETVRTYSGFGPHTLAAGDMDGDGALDVAIGAPNEVRLQPAGDFLANSWAYDATGRKDVAWGDVDGDRDLDLLVLNAGDDEQFVALFANDGSGNLGDAPAWQTEVTSGYSLDWGDFDEDGYIDFAVGRDGANFVYRNERDGTFSLFWSSAEEENTRAVGWADYDGDGDLDLAAGNYGDEDGDGEPNRIYENRIVDGERTFVNVWNSGETFHTTGLDWGDWDNDADLDLAVGNDGEVDQIYVNSNSSPGAPQLLWLWSSDVELATTGIGWGDMDNDGDLDLAVSQDGARLNGIYVNNLAVPTHLPDSGLGVAALVNPPPYVHAGRPGSTAAAYNFSSAEILSGPEQGEVTVDYRLYNPSSVRAANSSAITETLADVRHEFSLDGGGTWQAATPITWTFSPVGENSSAGVQGTFIWDAVLDQAISDNARFRVQVIQEGVVGPVQRVSAATTSPPFRVRAVTCVWPEDPEARPLATDTTAEGGPGFDFAVPAGEPVRFVGRIGAGTGPMYYDWQFGDGEAALGQVADHMFSNGTYTVRMNVRGEPCPQTRERSTTITVHAGTGVPDTHLPLVYATEPTTDTAETPDAGDGEGEAARAAAGAHPAGGGRAGAGLTRPPQVQGVSGDLQTGAETLWLRWEPVTATIDGYRIYGGAAGMLSALGDPAAAMAPVAELPPDATAYQVRARACGAIYWVVSRRGGRESLPSAGSYYTPPCDHQGPPTAP